MTAGIVVLDEIGFVPDIRVLMAELRIREGSPQAQDLRHLADEAQAVARPKALYRVVYPELRGEDTIIIDKVVLRSRVLRVNLDHAYRVFPYAATCGTELEAWTQALGDTLWRYWMDAVEMMALRSALQALDRHIETTYRPGLLADMSPGSLQDWPLEQQRPLFALLGDVEGAIGIQLLDSLLMRPVKSVSGIQFPTEESFESCQLCPREACPGRRAPYDPGLYDRKYGSG